MYNAHSHLHFLYYTKIAITVGDFADHWINNVIKVQLSTIKRGHPRLWMELEIEIQYTKVGTQLGFDLALSFV